MSIAPNNQPNPNAGRAADDKVREQGFQLVTLISAVVRIGRAYSVSNQVFRSQLANIATALRPILDEVGEAVFVVLDEDLYLNGIRIQVNAANFRFHRTVIDSFRNRAIAGLRFERGVQVEDLGRFFSIFLGGAAPHGAGLLKACADEDLQRVLPVVHVTTDPSLPGEDPWSGAEETAAAPEEPSVVENKPDADDGVPAASRGTTGRRHGQALQAARTLLMPTALNAGLQMRHAKRVVQPLVDGAFASEPVVVGLTGLHERDEYTYAHAVNVAAVAVTMGHFLGIDRRGLADLGVAALLHDVGKHEVNESIVHPMEGFTDEERAAAERHPLEGALLLARTTSLNSTTLRCMQVALEHHASPDGQGYPKLPAELRVSLIAQVVSVADCYVNLHSRSGDLVENVTPYEALGMMLGKLRDRFEPALLWALIQSVGFYPPGQLVQIWDGTFAQVLAPNKHDLARPHVRLLTDHNGRRLGARETRELLPIPAQLSVRRALVGEEARGWFEEPAQAA